MNFKILLSTLILATVCTLDAYADNKKAIIWDLGFTLMKPDNFKAAPHLGYITSTLFALQHLTQTTDLMRTSTLEVQDAYEPFGINQCPVNTALDIKGHPQPYLMQEWFSGKKLSKQVLEIALKAADTYKNYAPNAALTDLLTGENIHKNMIKGTFKWMFTPELFAEGQKIIKPGLALLEKLANIKDEAGKPKYEMYILSNFDGQTIEKVYENPKFKPIFKHFKPENIYISGCMFDMKPNHSIFKTIMRDAHLNPADCIFIDDQTDNCAAARELGIDAIQIKDNDYVTVEQELIKRTIITE